MKHLFLSFLFLLFVIIPIQAMNGPVVQVPDFRYPETVAKDAQKQLSLAVKSHDGHAIVSSLVQISLAKTSVSRHNLKEVCEQIDQVLNTDGLLTPDIQSLLYLLKAEVIYAAPSDVEYAQEDHENFWLRALDPLGNGDVSALGHPLSEYSDLITPGSELGNRAIPTLYDFIMMRVAHHRYLNYEQKQTWLSRHLLDADVLPRLYIEEVIAHGYTSSPWTHYYIRQEDVRLYEKYNKYPESGLFLFVETPDDKDYPVLQDYLSRFPSSEYSARIKNILANLEDKRVDLSYPSLFQTTDQIKVTAKSRNVNDIRLTLYRLPKTPDRRSSAMLDVTGFTAVQTVTVHADGKVPFNAEDLTAVFNPVPFGEYIVLASYDTPSGVHASKRMREDHVYSGMISISDLRTFEIRPSKIENREGYDFYSALPAQIFAVNSQTGRPEPQVKIAYRPDNRYRSSQEKSVQTYSTDDDGKVSLTLNGSFSYTLTKNEDRFLPEVSGYANNYDDRIFQSGLSVFTDLGIYRPGEEVRLSVLAWNVGFTKRQPAAQVKLQISFRDASGKEIEQKEVITDAMGQALVSFQIPTDRMNGRFSFRINSVDSRIRYTHNKYIDVSEYKTPTFMVDLADTDQHPLEGESVKVKGRVMTYSGMPVADTEVQCRLTASAWMWWFEANFTPRTFTVKTDKDGRFEYLCPKEWLEQEPQSNGRRPFLTYTVAATCTDAAGETHAGQRDFWMGRSRGLSASDATLRLTSGQPAAYEISFLSSDEAETSVRCHYDLLRMVKNDTVVVKSGEFLSDQQQYRWDKVPSGEYLLRAHIIGDEEAEKAEAKLVIYRESDALPPVSSSLWVPSESRQIDEKGKIRVLVGTTTGSHIYYIVSSRGRQESAGWLYYKPGLHWFTAQMPQALDEQINIDFYTVREGETFHEQAYFRAAWRDEAHLTAVSFRDKIRPGNHEHWTFRLTDQQGQPVRNGRMMLELYNDALNALSTNSWSFGAYTFSRSMHNFHQPSYRPSANDLVYNLPRVQGKNLDMKLPTVNYYDQSFFSQRIMTKDKGDRVSIKGYSANYAMSSAAPVLMERVMVEEAAAMEDAAGTEEEASSDNFGSMNDISVRSDEVKVALWLPQSSSDEEGNFEIEFDVPNYNTTYFLQALAYTPTLQTDRIQKKVLAQRPVMVQASLPRFLRSGDRIELAANVQNATDSLFEVDALIELFDPSTDTIVQTLSRKLQMSAHATEVLRISYQAPMDAPYIGFRVKALAADGNGDGEQQLLLIHSSITPVIETQPFYMQPETSAYSLDILAPTSAQGTSRLTLEYCNNPTWYCVTALPSIIDVDAITSPALAHNLFALSLAGKLTAENPLLAEAVRTWKARQGKQGDILVSQLQQNEDLKISPLLASPWLPEAERQTLRMQALDQLFDSTHNATITRQLITSLQKLQAKDGGFMWLDFGDRDEASYWATSQVLELVGEMHRLGCLPADADLLHLITEAAHYLDKQTLKEEAEMLAEVKKYGGKPSYLHFWSYVYTRQMLNDIAAYSSKTQAKQLMNIVNKTLKELERDWGALDMTSRARAAVTLHRYGRTSVARGVMESVRQFALHHPHKGMYWESLDRYSWFSPVACTSAMLQAFNEVSPRQAEIDEMRQWLLLEKQTSDWGSSSLASDAVYAILSTGSDWLHASADSIPQFEIRVDGHQLDLSETDRFLGYVRTTLPADAHRVEVTRTGVNPAWGSLYHQYQAEMQEVKEQHVEELAITKQMQRVAQDGTVQKLSEGDSLRVGDRIRVTLRIHAAKDLEYVTLVDQRPSFLEPVDQKSHYTRSERLYYYLETKDTVTKAFVNRLREGNHELTYDCYVTAPGIFVSGIATIQSQYAPQFVAHSAGDKMQVY